MPVSMNTRITASSRRPLKVRSFSQAARSRRSSASRRTGGGASGNLGGFMRSIGLELISPSSTNQLKKAWQPR